MRAIPRSPEVWFVPLDRLDPLALAELMPIGSPGHRRLTTALDVNASHAADLRHRAIAHAALRLLLARWVGDAIAFAAFASGPHGKPRLQPVPPAVPSLDFSLSHSGAAALVGITATGRIGVDIEAPRTVRIAEARRDRLLALARGFGGELQLRSDQPDDRLLAAWVRLEAVAKATGEGMGRFLTRHGVIGAPAEIGDDAGSPALEVHDLDLPAPYLGAIAASTTGLPSPAALRFPESPGSLRVLLASRPA